MPDHDSSEEKELSIEELLERFHANQEAEQKIIHSLGFDWRHSPRIDHGLISGHPVGGPVTLKFTLPSGREIRLSQLHQYYVYSGLLCGWPRDPESYFLQAIDLAKEHFPGHERAPQLLEPAFHTGKVVRKTPGGVLEGPWEKLPDVCTIAEFESNQPARDESGVYSSMLVIWFQDHYGLPDDSRTLEQLGNLDWEKCGYDWTP